MRLLAARLCGIPKHEILRRIDCGTFPKPRTLSSTGKRIREAFEGLIDKVVLTPEEGVKGLRIDLYEDLAGILNMSLETKDMKILDKLCLNASNDNKAFAHIDRIGSGGWI
jgi:hypothetical protein